MNNWKVVTWVCLLGVGGLLAVPKITIAQNKSANLLEREIDSSDPVIPLGYGRRELSSFEINRIRQEMSNLNQSAVAKLAQGNGKEAFKLWYRQLRLARAIDAETEVEALGKVGAIAWQENRGSDLRNIANRLIALEKTNPQKDLTPELRSKLAIAYQQVRYPEQAIAIYEQILVNSRQQEDLAAIEENLETLGKLYFAKFDYQEAIATYEELLTLTEAKSSSGKQVNFYLDTLIDLYEGTGQTQQAISTRKRLINNYRATIKSPRIAAMKLAIARDYETLKQTPAAIAAYNQAFTLARKNQQLAIANNALKSLGKLYQKEGAVQRAIATYTKLLKIQRQSYNYYGLINTYDTLGKIYLNLEQNQQAKEYFQQALELGKDLDYKVKYFQGKIQQIVE